MHNEMPVSGAGITGSAFPEWRFPLYRNSGFHDRTGGVKQPGILIPSFRREDTANPVDKIPQFREWSTIIPELDTADFLNLYTVFMRFTA